MKKFSTLLFAFFSVCSAIYGQAPANDDCSNPTPISLPSGGSACITGSTIGATATTWSTPNCGQTNWTNDVWYTFVSTGTDNTVIVSPTGNPAAQVLGISVFEGTCANLAGSPGSCEIATTNGATDTAIYPAPVGTVFYVEVSSFGTAGNFQLCVTSTTPPPAPGNTCATAAHLCTEAPFTVANVPHGGSSFTPYCFGGTPADGQWYQFTVGVAGQLAWRCKPTAANIELDWAFYDITNGCPTNPTSQDFLTCNYNFSGAASNPIGMSPTTSTVCPDSNITNQARKEICPSEILAVGHTYAIFINNYSYPVATGWNFNFDSSTFVMAPVDTFFVSPDTICGSTGTVTITNGSAASTWQQWNFGDGTNSLVANPGTHTYNGSGVYFISLKDSSQTCSAVSSKSVLIAAYPTLSVPNDTICPGANGTLTATPSVPGGKYLWSTGATTATITATVAGNTTYTVTYTSAVGCSASATATITVSSSTGTITPPAVTVCPGTSSTLTASAGTAYIWSNGATTATITVTPASNTTYNVTITETGGCTATAGSTVTVSNNASTTITPAAVTICPGSNTTLNSGTGIGYVWSNGATTAGITVSPVATTTYIVTVTVTGTCTATASSVVTVANNAVAIITPANATICPAASTTLTASGGNTYSWSNGLTTATITVSPASTTTYTVTATSATGCTATANATVTVANNGTASVTPSTAVICPGGNATFTASTGASYNWSNGASSATVTVSPLANTTYTVTVTSAGGCTATASAAVTVSNNLTTAITPQPDTICPGNSTTLTAATASGYLWSDGTTASSITVSPAGTTNYSVTVSSGGTCTASASATVVVSPFAITISPASSNICAGQTVTLTCSYHSNNVSGYQWSNPQIGNSQGVTVSPAATTTYSVTVSNANSCTASASAVVTVDAAFITITPTSASVCSGQSTTLTANGATAYAWSTGSGSASVTVSPAMTTTYVVTGSDAQGCLTTDSAVVTVGAMPTATFNVTTPLCAGQSGAITFTGTSSNAAVYTWNFNGGTIVSGTGKGPYQVSWNSAGTQNVSLAVTDNGCVAIPDTEVVTVNQLPAAFAGDDTAYCNGNSAVIGTASTAGYTYLWSPATGLSSAVVSNPTTSLTNPGGTAITQTYTVTATDNGCTASSSMVLTVNPVPAALFAQQQAQCLNVNRFNFAALGNFAPSDTFAWTFGTNAIPPTSTSQSQTVTYTAAQTTAVSLTISHAGCVSNTYVDSVTVNPMPVAGFSADTLTGCPNTNVCFLNTSESAGNNTTYLWNFGDGQTSTLKAPCHVFAAPGAYTVGLEVTANNCSSDSTRISYITINAAPTAKFIPDVNTIQLPQTEIDFTNLSSNALTYLWNFGGLGNSSDIDPSFNFTQYGLYHVVLNAYNTFGCSDSFTLPIKVLPPQSYFIPNVFTPNNDGNNDKFYIEMQEGVTVLEFTVFDRWGEKVHDGQYPWDGTYKGKPCPDGVYIYIFKLKLATNTEGIMRTGSVTLVH